MPSNFLNVSGLSNSKTSSSYIISVFGSWFSRTVLFFGVTSSSFISCSFFNFASFFFSFFCSFSCFCYLELAIKHMENNKIVITTIRRSPATMTDIDMCWAWLIVTGSTTVTSGMTVELVVANVYVGISVSVWPVCLSMIRCSVDGCASSPGLIVWSSARLILLLVIYSKVIPTSIYSSISSCLLQMHQVSSQESTYSLRTWLSI